MPEYEYRTRHRGRECFTDMLSRDVVRELAAVAEARHALGDGVAALAVCEQDARGRADENLYDSENYLPVSSDVEITKTYGSVVF